MNEDRITPFSNGSEYMHWLSNNCAECKKDGDCFIQKLLEIANDWDGTVSEKTYSVMGAGSGKCTKRKVD